MMLKKMPNIASQAFRHAANAVQKSDNWLGDYFRRMKAKGGNKYAIVATANKIATIYYKWYAASKSLIQLILKITSNNTNVQKLLT
ncbi:MAG TPA: hypothetical protein VNT20_17205 [Flavisolibacter sp.]|nr:hypothetical protein [Flavisolibacter sp.]